MTLPAPTEPGFLVARSGVSIAYHATPGKSPGRGGLAGIVFLGGFASDMSGTKALALDAFARERGQACLRFDYRGHGRSMGRFEEGTIGAWREDALAVLDRLTQGPQILVGSSMGGWIMLLVALARPERIKALVGVAAAPDFTEDLIWARLSGAERERLLGEGVIYQPSPYAERPDAITSALIEDGRRHLLLRGPIAIECPVRLLHGQRDEDVPWQRSLELASLLVGQDVWVTLVKDGDHRLSRAQDLLLLTRTLAQLSDG